MVHGRTWRAAVRAVVAVAVLGWGGVALARSDGTTPRGDPLVQAATEAGGVYVPVTPVRILDTREGLGAHDAPMVGGETMTLQVVGSVAQVPAAATAVVLNVTVTEPVATSYLTLWPTGQIRPLASNLNWIAGRTIPNLVIVRLGVGGQVSMYNDSGLVDVIADVAGYFVPESSGVGPQGPPGEQGPQGIRGPSGLASVTRKRSAAVDVGADGRADDIAYCDTLGEERILSGGAVVVPDGLAVDDAATVPVDADVVASYPTVEGGWRVITQGGQEHDDMYVLIVCAND